MLIKKSISIGVIALFIALAVVPMSSATVEEKETLIPIELSVVNADGSLGTKIISMTGEQVEEFIKLLDEIKDLTNRDSILERILDFFRHNGLRNYFSMELLQLLPGKPIFSVGNGRSLLTRYHARFQAKKIFAGWHYPSGFGCTLIWGDGIIAPPTQVLLMRQIGFMIGFVGIYIYIPPLIQGTASRTCFVGSTLFAYGISL
jgi:hypothetical protein